MSRGRGREGEGWMEGYRSRGEWGEEGKRDEGGGEIERELLYIWRDEISMVTQDLQLEFLSYFSAYQLKTWGWLLSLSLSTKLAPKGPSESSSLLLQWSAQWCINFSHFFLEVLASRVCYFVVSLGILFKKKANGIENQQIFQRVILLIGFIAKYMFLWPKLLALLQMA